MTKNTLSNDFIGTFGQDYALFCKAYTHHDELQSQVANAVGKSVARGVVEHLADPKVIELGCGTGETTLPVLLANPGIDLHCVDSSSDMLAQHRAVVGDVVTTTQDDALHYLTQQQENSVDAICSAWTIHNFDNDYRTKVLEQCYRVLKPRGTFINADKYAHDDLDKRHKAFNWSVGRLLGTYMGVKKNTVAYDWVQHMARDERPEIIMPEGEAVKLMKKIGFENIRVPWRVQMEALLIANKK